MAAEPERIFLTETPPIGFGSPSSSSSTRRDMKEKEQEQVLPIANVGRIMKKSLPTNAKISKEAKETVQTCVSEFISFITGEAADKCQREKRKTINGDDLLWAMTTLGFENYAGPLMLYLTNYRHTETEGDHIHPNISSCTQEEDSHQVTPIGYEENWGNAGFPMGNLKFHQLG